MKNPLQKKCLKIGNKEMSLAKKSNAACDVCQRRLRSLELPHAKLAIAPCGICAKSMLRFATSIVAFVLSLLSPSKRLFANRRFQRETRFKPLFSVQGRKVPPDKKQAVCERLIRKNLYKSTDLS
jgi:hypothetical protein